MSNRRKLRPGQVAVQDQALARVRDFAREHDAVVAVYAAPSRVCTFVAAGDSPCFGSVSVVQLRLRGDPRPPAEYPGCGAHVLLVASLVVQTLRSEGVVDQMGLTVDRRLDGAPAP